MQARRRELFTTIRTEGAILPPDLLERIAAGDKDLGGLKPADYHLFEGEPLNEAIVRSWNRLVGAWAAFSEAREKLPEDDLGTTVTRERWLLILFDELGYGRLQPARAAEIEGKSYAASHAWGDHIPIHLVGCKVPLDRRSQGVVGAASMSPHGLVQELLNRSDERLWGFVSNGLTLRVLRDNSSLTRQAYVEFDLASMMDGDVYADFVVLWLVCHESRIEGDAPHACWLERWSQEAVKQGTRALDGLRAGVEAAISSLGGGFLSHPANADLRDALRSGDLDKQEYYRELLRLVYRLLFLFVAEDRMLLFDPDATQEAAERYDRFYSTRRLRRLADRRRGSKHADLYQGLRVVMEKLGDDDGCPDLGLPALGSYLWSADATPHLSTAELPNTALLDSVRALATLEERGVRRTVDYRNLGAEELGSVYESLLELHPELDINSGAFVLTTAAGNERKTTGSYYTPTSLISCLLDSALDPVLEEAATKGEQAILDLKVCDPACGSGHFLVAAAHRIAKRLASERTGDDEPSPEATRTALRDVVGRCLFGVDVNPMAVELCKVSLWVEALEPGKPLSFLEAHVKCGNSLLGTTMASVDEGIPDGAYKPIAGDESSVASEWKRRNRTEREGQLTITDLAVDLVFDLRAEARQLEAGTDDTVEEIRGKERLFAELTASGTYARARLAADAWCAGFVQHKTVTGPQITTGVVRRIASGDEASQAAKEGAKTFASDYGFFHWELEFPQVFGDDAGGFDLVIGNPPWDRTEFKEREFFSTRAPDIANARTAALRKTMIKDLEQGDPSLFHEYKSAVRHVAASDLLARASGFFPMSGRGRTNLYALFVERMTWLLNDLGQVGVVCPSGFVSDESTSVMFSTSFERGSIASFLDFENRLRLFPDIDVRSRFALLTLRGRRRWTSGGVPFFFFAQSADDLRIKDRWVQMTWADIKLVNPRSLTAPIVRSQRDLDLMRTAHQRFGALASHHEDEQWYSASSPGLMNTATASSLFVPVEDLSSTDQAGPFVRLYEAKYCVAFDHRSSSYINGDLTEFADASKRDPHLEVIARYYVAEREYRASTGTHAKRGWWFGWRDITSATNERTLIPVVTPDCSVADTLPLLHLTEVGAGHVHVLWAQMASFACDFIARLKTGGTHATVFMVEQLPIITVRDARTAIPWESNTTLSSWVKARVLELAFSAHDLAPFARSLGYAGPPFQWDPERRALLRAELDAAFFHLYGLAEEDVDYVMETFPIVKRRDEEKFGPFRTKMLILDVYRTMADAISTGVPYETILDPPPADPRVAHEPAHAKSV